MKYHDDDDNKAAKHDFWPPQSMLLAATNNNKKPPQSERMREYSFLNKNLRLLIKCFAKNIYLIFYFASAAPHLLAVRVRSVRSLWWGGYWISCLRCGWCAFPKKNQNFVYSYRVVLMRYTTHTFHKISAHHTYTIYEWCGLPCRYDGRKKERKATAPRSCSMPYFNTSTNISYLWNKYDCANPSKNICPIVFLSRSPNNLSNFYQLYTVSCILCYAILYLY